MTADEALSVAENCFDSTMGYTSKVLAAEVRRLREGGWISVEERLPFDDAPSDWKGCLCDDFLVAIRHSDPEDGVTVTMYEYNPSGWHYLGGEPTTYADEVTHWMPRPEPPHG
jgi:hypothetical protein